jgi:tRNA A-37 threonylcarbamoyl transferase component Bud32
MDYTVDRLIVDLLESNLTDEYKTTLIFSLVQNMFDIVKKLGDNKIFHGDIHFGNFMIKNSEMKIIDFGLGMIIKESMSTQFYLEQLANFLVVFPENSLAVTRHPEIMDKVYINIKKNVQEEKKRLKMKK